MIEYLDDNETCDAYSFIARRPSDSPGRLISLTLLNKPLSAC